MSGVSLLKIQTWAGHSDPKMTKDHYAHLAPEYDSEIELITRSGYNLVTKSPEPEEDKSRYPLLGNGLSHLHEWRERRGSNPRPKD